MPHDPETTATIAAVVSAEPAPKKMGRPSVLGRPMTAAERKKRSRDIKDDKEKDKERRTLIAKLFKIYKQQESSVFATEDGPSTHTRRIQLHKERRQYLADLEALTLDDLRLAVEGKSIPDSHGKPEGEAKSGGKSIEILEKIEAKAIAAATGKVTPEGAGPEGKGGKTAPKPFDTEAFNRQLKTSATFDGLAAASFDSENRCVICHEMEGRSGVFTSASRADQVAHLRAEYRAGEKLSARIAEMSDPALEDLAPAFVKEAIISNRKALQKNLHHWAIRNWLKRGLS